MHKKHVLFSLHLLLQGVPIATEPSISLIILPLMRILQRNLKRTTDTHYRHIPFHFSHILKFRCNILIGVIIIKEMQLPDDETKVSKHVAVQITQRPLTQQDIGFKLHDDTKISKHIAVQITQRPLTQQGIGFKLPDDETKMSKHVAVQITQRPLTQQDIGFKLPDDETKMSKHVAVQITQRPL